MQKSKEKKDPQKDNIASKKKEGKKETEKASSCPYYDQSKQQLTKDHILVTIRFHAAYSENQW